MASMILELPSDVLANICMHWVNYRDMVIFDAAACSSSVRSAILAILRHDGFMLDLGQFFPRKNEVGRMKWITSRSVKVDTFAFCGTADVFVTAMFLKSTGHCLEDLELNDLQPQLTSVMCLIGLLCVNLRVIDFNRCGEIEGSALTLILSTAAQTLKMMAMKHVTIAGDASIAPLSKMTSLYVGKEVVISSNTLCTLTTNCASLLSFYCTDLGKSDDCLHALAQHCRQLRSFQYGRAASGSTAGLVEVLQACADLHTVGFLSSEGIGDEHLRAVALHHPFLTALQIVFTDGEQEITDAGLEQLCAQCSQLLHLRLSNLYCVSDAVLHSITQQCSSLETLSLQRLEGALSEQALVALFTKLRSLDDLDLRDVAWLSDAVLQAIATSCTSLRVIDIIDASGFGAQGLAALAKESAALRYLYINEKHEKLNDTTVLVWKVLRPQVEFRHDKFCTTEWDDFRLDA